MKGLYLDCCPKIFFVCFFHLVFLVSLCISQKPQILSEYENVVEAGDNFDILCQGDSPIIWTWPEIQQDSIYTEWTTIEIFDDVPKDKAYKYGSRLFIQNATFVYTGFYQCFYNNTDTSNKQQSETYLYVRDDEHLSVVDMEVTSLLVLQYSDAVIPCRPTSPEVNVELKYVTGELIPLDTILEDEATYRYDPHYGFITNQTQSSAQYIFYCTFKNDSRMTHMVTIMDVEPLTLSLPKPLLKKISDGYSILGDKLVLECVIKAVTHVTFKWTTPTGPVNLNRMEISQTHTTVEGDGLVSKRLTVNRSLTKDSGVYYCDVNDNQNHHSRANLDVKIHDEFISLKEENDVSEFSAEVGSPLVQWHVRVRAYPETTLFWLNNNNEIIPEGSSEKYITKADSSEAVLKILNINVNDFGRYTLIAVNKFETKNLVLFLNRKHKSFGIVEGNKNYT